jgi:hypothetical protein
MVEDNSQSEKKHYKGSAEGTAEEKAAVGGEKTLSLSNIFFQSDANAQTIADALLARLKTRKKYEEASIQFCPVPVELDDTVSVEEFITNDKSITHLGLIRQVKVDVTPTSQVLTLVLEE